MIDVLEILEERKASLRAVEEEVRALQSRIEQLQENMQPVQAEIDSLEHVQRIDESRRAKGGDAPRDTTPSFMGQLRAQRTQKEAMLLIARQNGGLVNVKEAKSLMIKAGKITGATRYAYRHMYDLVEKDERYEQVGKARFQLKAEFI